MIDEIWWDLIFVARAALAAALAFMIGWERELRGSPAGDRTYAMVAVGAAAFTAIGVEAFPATAEKLIAGVVTGVGFLGAGMIMREGPVVRGLTTAASIWAVASIGVAVGAGEYVVGTLLALLILLILEMHYLPLLSRLGSKQAQRRVAEALAIDVEPSRAPSREEQA